MIALVGIVATSVWLVERTQVYFEDVVEARDARQAAVQLRNLLQDAQSGQRGYLLTRDETYLVPYRAALASIPGALIRLEAVLTPHPQATGPLVEFRAQLDAKLAELTHTVELGQTGQFVEAIAIVRTDEGFALMEQMRTLLDAVIAAADALSFEGVVDQRAAWNNLRLVSVVGGLVILGVVGAAALTVIRYTRDLETARVEVETLNADLEGRVAERTTELMRANEEVQRFAYIVTHDLRAPLVNIMGFTSELEAAIEPIGKLIDRHPEDAGDPELEAAKLAAREDLPEAVGFIRSSTRKMDGLINAILKISREGQRQLKAERVDLAETIETALGSVRHQIDEQDGRVEVSVKTPPVFTDKLALEQILGNLLDNAIKYHQPGRPTVLGIEGWQEANGRIVISVADNGRGITPEDHERVFELFRRSGTQNISGEGIGLAHVRIMARNLGGDITLTSTPGEGTRFNVTLAPDLRTIVRNKG
ncbi:sensor histidine kinase [Pelagibacterium sediminicola]|uniref:sensor histidine kinase n=1 Tax=Pelagibacterium sediminicola TaxID=2248761 RepID=UPI001FE45615|nr:CHASE3 domain-containing protein [Pelagibacterium sediminicola]